ncbi:hypothetical protein LOC68_13950 [Blastopirellula sp. JC732]|uniref:CvpA family protein n=1 Tax=Blastopirellula sediminis TaxID=2894196 RepID=A0A9X1MNF3_9BACT|nr:hypothetical protein [Blastopirellula sediminis]MCC9607215.1 hypothetical protein [Blastopirellula sediminis]MCC9629492.1 hypothetical protein [Blastopirellula sediminis]
MNMNYLVLLILQVAFFALTFSQGFWTCALMMFNITFAGVMAANYATPLANLLVSLYDGLFYFSEFLSMWILFLIFFAITRAITEKLSPVPVRIGGGTREQILDYVFCGWASSIFLAWCAFSFFAAPIGAEGFQNMMRGSAFSASGAIFGGWYVQLPSTLGMGLLGKPFETDKYIESRLKRNAELKTKKGLFDTP